MKHLTPQSFGNKVQPTVNWTNKLNPVASGSSKLPMFRLPAMRPNGPNLFYK